MEPAEVHSLTYAHAPFPTAHLLPLPTLNYGTSVETQTVAQRIAIHSRKPPLPTSNARRSAQGRVLCRGVLVHGGGWMLGWSGARCSEGAVETQIVPVRDPPPGDSAVRGRRGSGTFLAPPSAIVPTIALGGAPMVPS